MSAPKFTPGPWTSRLSPKGGEFYIEAPKADGTIWLLGTASGRSPETDAANASLIGAAPDLYEALRRAMPFVMDAENGDPALVKAVDAALAKAEGRKP